MADPDRDTVYTNDGTNRTIYTRETNSTGWFVGIIVALALLAIAYLVFSANSQPSSTTVDLNNTPTVTTPAVPAPGDTNTTPMAPADNGVTMSPATPAPTTPAESTVPSAPEASTAPAISSAAPATSSVAP